VVPNDSLAKGMFKVGRNLPSQKLQTVGVKDIPAPGTIAPITSSAVFTPKAAGTVKINLFTLNGALVSTKSLEVKAGKAVFNSPTDQPGPRSTYRSCYRCRCQFPHQGLVIVKTCLLFLKTKGGSMNHPFSFHQQK